MGHFLEQAWNSLLRDLYRLQIGTLLAIVRKPHANCGEAEAWTLIYDNPSAFFEN